MRSDGARTRPMVVESGSRGQFSPTPNRGRHGGTILSARGHAKKLWQLGVRRDGPPHQPGLRPMVVERGSRWHFSTTPNRGQRGATVQSTRIVGRVLSTHFALATRPDSHFAPGSPTCFSVCSDSWSAPKTDSFPEISSILPDKRPDLG